MSQTRMRRSRARGGELTWVTALFLVLLTAALMGARPEFPAPPPGEYNFHPSPKQLASNQEILGWIKDICAFGNRRPGTQADRDTANYILQKFKEFGLQDAHLEPVPVPLWTATKWSLTVNGKDAPCFYINHSYWTGKHEGFTAGAAGIQAEMVYVGDGTDKEFKKVDVKGKIVLADVRFSNLSQKDFLRVAYFGYDPEYTVPDDWTQADPYSANNFPGNFQRAIDKGAVGFVGILVDYYDTNQYYNELYVEKPYQWPIPGLWLSRSDGAKLKASLKADAPNQAHLVLDGTVVAAEGQNVIGYLPGKSSDVVMVHSHHDAPWASAVEDASGAAEVLALAQYFGSLPPETREKTLMFATMDTHFSMYQAHLQEIARIRHQKMNVILDVCIEHIAKEAQIKDGKLVMTGQIEPRGIFVTENPYLLSITEQAIVRNNLERIVLLPTYTILGVVSDAGDFNRNGFTIISYISPPVYIYGPEDTIDMIAVDQLNPVATAFADIIESVNQTPSKTVQKKSWIPKHRFHYLSAALGYIKDMIKE
ncbi:MAG TPA: M28 family peptidase [bacterium]|nr:M28 family peptidase [bacterium]